VLVSDYSVVSNNPPPLPQAPGGPCEKGGIPTWENGRWICVIPSPQPVFVVPTTVVYPIYWYGSPLYYYGPRYRRHHR
jgi:hypothetical protein